MCAASCAARIGVSPRASTHEFFRHVLIWAGGCGQEVVEVVEIESYVATPAAHAAAQLAYVYTYLWLCDLRPAEGSRASGGGPTEMTSRLIHEVVRPAMMLSDPPPRAS